MSTDIPTGTLQKLLKWLIGYISKFVAAQVHVKEEVFVVLQETDYFAYTIK